MDFVLDQEILDDFISQVETEEKRLSEIINLLRNDTTQSELFEESGQISDRIFGAVAMFNIPEFATYSRKVKEMCYKCAQTESDHEKARSKCFQLIEKYFQAMVFVKDNVGKMDDIVAKSIEHKIEISKVDKLLSSYLHSIKTGSVAFEDDQKFIFVYDKSSIMELDAKAKENIIFPKPKFFNAIQGFTRGFERDRETVYGVVIDTSDEGWASMVKNIRSFDPVIPIIVTSKKRRGIDKVDKKKLQIQGLLVVNGNFEKVTELFKKIYKKREFIGEQISNSSNDDISQNRTDYVEVSSTIFKMGVPSPFDVFLPVGSKILKVIRKDEAFCLASIERHIKKGVEKYLILESEHIRFMKAFDDEIKNIYDNPEIGFSEKKENFLDYAQDVQCFFDEKNIDENALMQVKEFVDTSEKLITEVAKDNEILKSFFADIAVMEHATSICLMAGLFLNHIDAKKDIYDDIALTCYLHDIALKDEDDIIKYGRLELMNEDQKKIYYAHPKKGARLLIELGIKPALAEAVAHHHMRFDGSGFPKRDPGIPLNSIAEVIAMADEFLDVIKTCEADNSDPVKNFKIKMKGRFSDRLQKVFAYAFKDS